MEPSFTPLETIKSAPEWAGLSEDEKLSIYDKWSKLAKEEARKRSLPKDEEQKVDYWLTGQREQIRLEHFKEHGDDGNVWDSLRRGLVNVEAGIKTQVAGAQADYAKSLERAKAEGLVPEKHQETVDSRIEEAKASVPRNLQEAGEAADIAGAFPVDAGVREFTEAEGFKGKSKALFSNFGSIVANTLAESAPSVVAAVGGGVVAGAPGAFAGGAGAEFTASYREALETIGEEAGIDTSTPEGLAEALQNDDVNQAAIKRAATRSGVIGSVDAITGGIAGKIVSKFGAGTAKKLAGVATETAIGAPAGSAGEALAQVASGQELDPNAIVLEGVGQVGTAAGQSVAAVAKPAAVKFFSPDAEEGQRYKDEDGTIREITKIEETREGDFVKREATAEAVEETPEPVVYTEADYQAALDSEDYSKANEIRSTLEGEDGLLDSEREDLEREYESELLGRLRENAVTLDEAIDSIGGLISPSRAALQGSEFNQFFNESGERVGNQRIGRFRNDGVQYDQALPRLREFGFYFDTTSELKDALERVDRGESVTGIPQTKPTGDDLFSRKQPTDGGGIFSRIKRMFRRSPEETPTTPEPTPESPAPVPEEVPVESVAATSDLRVARWEALKELREDYAEIADDSTRKTRVLDRAKKWGFDEDELSPPKPKNRTPQHYQLPERDFTDPTYQKLLSDPESLTDAEEEYLVNNDLAEFIGPSIDDDESPFTAEQIQIRPFTEQRPRIPFQDVDVDEGDLELKLADSAQAFIEGRETEEDVELLITERLLQIDPEPQAGESGVFLDPDVYNYLVTGDREPETIRRLFRKKHLRARGRSTFGAPADTEIFNDTDDFSPNLDPTGYSAGDGYLGSNIPQELTSQRVPENAAKQKRGTRPADLRRKGWQQFGGRNYRSLSDAYADIRKQRGSGKQFTTVRDEKGRLQVFEKGGESPPSRVQPETAQGTISLQSVNDRAESQGLPTLPSDATLNTLRNLAGETDLPFFHASARGLVNRGYAVDNGGKGRERYSLNDAGKALLGAQKEAETPTPVPPAQLTGDQKTSVQNAIQSLSEANPWGNTASISEVIDQTGLPERQVKDYLLDQSKTGDFVLSEGDWASASEQERNAHIPFDGKQFIKIRMVTPETAAATNQDPLVTFSNNVLKVTNTLRTPPFNDRVTIAQVYDAYGKKFPDAGSLDSFKQRLLSARQNGLILLSRLDSPRLVDKAVRDRSALPFANTETHLILKNPPRQQTGRDELRSQTPVSPTENRSRASQYEDVFTEEGVDPDQAVLLPIGEQFRIAARNLKKNFGLSVKQDGSIQGRDAVDSLMDARAGLQNMAAAIGLPNKVISLFGRVKLTVARDTSLSGINGTFSRSTKTIKANDRTNVFAHEWAHALDFELLENAEYVKDTDSLGATGDRRKGGAAGLYEGRLDGSFSNLMRAIFHDQAALADQIRNLELQLEKASTPKAKADIVAKLEALDAGAATTEEPLSSYQRESEMAGEYWQMPTEMFARAFEAYVAHKIEQQGGDSVFVANTLESFRDLYPNGEERDAIFAAFDNLFTDLATEQAYQGEKADTFKSLSPSNPLNWMDGEPDTKRGFAGIIEKEWEAHTRERATAKRRAEDRPKTSLLKKMEAVRAGIFSAMRAEMAIMERAYKDNPPAAQAFRRIKNTIATTPGSGQLQSANFQEEVEIESNTKVNKIMSILRTRGLDPKRFTDEQEKTLIDLLTTADTPRARNASAAMKSAAAAMRRVLDEEYRANIRSGIDIGYTKNGYMPRMYDREKAFADRPAFIQAASEVYRIMRDNEVAALEKDLATAKADLNNREQALSHLEGKKDSKEQRSKLTKEVNALSNEIGRLTDKIKQVKGQDLNKKAEAWHYRMVYGDDEAAFDAQGPDQNYTKSREMPPEADQIMREFLVKNPIDSITSYLEKSSRRIAYNKRFGAKNEKRIEMMTQLKQAGVDPVDIERISMILDRATGLRQRRLGEHHDYMSSFIHTVGTLTMLPRAVYASIAEPMTIAIRSGRPRDVLTSIRNIARQMNNAEIKELSEFLGTVGDPITDSVMASRIGGGASNSKHNALLNEFFERTQLSPLTRVQRRSATLVGISYLQHLGRRLKRGGEVAEQARQEFNDLGISDHESFSDFVLALDEIPSIADLENNPHQFEFAVAVNRFVDQAIQNPKAVDRPQMANDPVGRIAYSIMSFNISFYENVIKGTARRLKNSKTPVASAVGVIPGLAALYAAQTVISTLRYSITNPERWEEEEGDTWLDKALQPETFQRGFSRSFPLGTIDPILQAISGLKYNRSLTTITSGAHTGYFLQGLASMLNYAVGSNSELTNTAERGFYKGLFEVLLSPSINWALTSVPAGPVTRPIAGAAMQKFTSQGAKSQFADMFAGRKYQFSAASLTLLKEAGYSEKDIVNDPNFHPSGKKNQILKSDVENWLSKR